MPIKGVVLIFGKDDTVSKNMRIKALASIIFLVERYKDDYHNRSEMDEAIKELNEA